MNIIERIEESVKHNSNLLDQAQKIVDHGIEIADKICNGYPTFVFKQEPKGGKISAYSKYKYWYIISWWVSTDRPGHVTVKTYLHLGDNAEVVISDSANYEAIEQAIHDAVVHFLTIGKYWRM